MFAQSIFLSNLIQIKRIESIINEVAKSHENKNVISKFSTKQAMVF